MTFDDQIDQAAQDDPEWVAWSQPQRLTGAIDKLFTETLPRVPTDWTDHTGDAIGPMPQGVAPYSREMVDYWLKKAFNYLIPDDDALYERDNADLANQFVCYIGEYFVRYCRGTWVNDPEAKLLYPFGPSICYDWTDDADYPVNMLFDAAETDGFMAVGFDWYSRTVDYVKAHDLPLEQIEQGRKLDLG